MINAPKLTWIKEKNLINVMSSKFETAYIVKISESKWRWIYYGLSRRYMTEGYSSTEIEAKAACERLWSKWLDTAGLMPKPSASADATALDEPEISP